MKKILHGLRSVPQLFDRKCPICQKVSSSKQRNAIHVADGNAIGLFFFNVPLDAIESISFYCCRVRQWNLFSLCEPRVL